MSFPTLRCSDFSYLFLSYLPVRIGYWLGRACVPVRLGSHLGMTGVPVRIGFRPGRSGVPVRIGYRLSRCGVPVHTCYRFIIGEAPLIDQYTLLLGDTWDYETQVSPLTPVHYETQALVLSNSHPCLEGINFQLPQIPLTQFVAH